MKINKLNFIIILGLIAIIGILIAQLLWTKEAFNLEEQKFSQKTNIALIEVAKKLFEGNNQNILTENPVKKIANDYYIVNIENDFEPEILEFYLKTEFVKRNINTDFEYAMYNCQSDEMVYGNYVSFNENRVPKTSVYFPKHKNLVYYFAIRFPSKTTYLFSSLKFWFVLSLTLILILIIYVYSIFTILQQKKYSELQRDFINNMTHEFKTPLSSILIASNYLKNQNEIQNNHKLEKYTEIIINQSKKLNNHIEKILNIAKSDNSPLLLELEKRDIYLIINEVIENINLKYPDAKIKITTNQKAVFWIIDEFHFTNLIYNLLDNSIKYCEKIPEILIEISDNKIAFSDNGIGIEPKELNHVFEKFYRIKTNKNATINGFGLGLYYVHKIVKLHHWNIQIQNNLSNGIKVTITQKI